MLYNPIFEEETERGEEMKDLRKSIRFRAARKEVFDLCLKLLNFTKNHPIATVAALAGFMGMGIGRK